MTKLISLFTILLLTTNAHAQSLKLLYLGDNGHHQPRVRFQQLQPVMKQRGIELVYTDQMKDLNPATLKDYAGLVVYANIDNISKEQADALLTFVAEGKGFIPLHCASYCFRNNDDVVKLIGAQFKSHGTGTFRTVQAKLDHPVVLRALDRSKLRFERGEGSGTEHFTKVTMAAESGRRLYRPLRAW